MNTILGTMNIEYQYSSLIDKSNEKYASIIQKYIDEVPDPILDTAYYYGNTKTEQVLGDILPTLTKKPKIATKANPWYNNDFTNGQLGQLSPDNLEFQLNTSLKNLKLNSVDIFYLHCPDHETPIKDTLEKCDELWRKEKYREFGISNFSKDQLKEILDITENNGFIKPIYYQGMYNIISRKVEEIFPLLHNYDIQFWAYNPLAGGLLTGKYNNGLITNSRLGDNKIYQNIFWKEKIINNLEDFFKLDNCTEVSFQWLKNNSKLRLTDKIIIGASTTKQLETNIILINKDNNFNNDFLKYLDDIYFNIDDISPNYYY